VAADCSAVVALPNIDDMSAQDPPVTQTIVVHEYSVQGPSVAEVRSQLDACGPHDETGTRHDAYTKWYVSWGFGFDTSNGCRVDPVKVQLVVDMYVPRLDADANAPTAAPWAAYRTALLAHENGHVQNGIDAANQAEAAMSSLAPAATCDEAKTLANQAAQQVTDAFAQRDLAYDADTDHGRSEGAVFPIS
jgi:predicted secreted Zn-dependent protease